VVFLDFSSAWGFKLRRERSDWVGVTPSCRGKLIMSDDTGAEAVLSFVPLFVMSEIYNNGDGPNDTALVPFSNRRTRNENIPNNNNTDKSVNWMVAQYNSGTRDIMDSWSDSLSSPAVSPAASSTVKTPAKRGRPRLTEDAELAKQVSITKPDA